MKIDPRNRAEASVDPTELSQLLLTHGDYVVMCNVALNENTSIDDLVLLSDADHWAVRFDTVFNQNTPVDVLDKLSRDPNQSVRRRVAMCHRTPLYNILILRNDLSQPVSEAAEIEFERRSVLDELLGE